VKTSNLSCGEMFEYLISQSPMTDYNLDQPRSIPVVGTHFCVRCHIHAPMGHPCLAYNRRWSFFPRGKAVSAWYWSFISIHFWDIRAVKFRFRSPYTPSRHAGYEQKNCALCYRSQSCDRVACPLSQYTMKQIAKSWRNFHKNMYLGDLLNFYNTFLRGLGAYNNNGTFGT
jgi:hypothetical protein